MSWSEFLAYMSDPNGISVIVGFVLSVVVEYIPKFGDLAAKWKRAIFFLVSVAIPVLAALLGCLTAEWPWSFEATFWPALMSGFLAFGSGTIAHMRLQR